MADRQSLHSITRLTPGSSRRRRKQYMKKKIWTQQPIERQPGGALLRPTPKQARCIRKLIKKCCNYADGNCLLLDDGEEQVCPQSISYSLNCRYFRHAVLPGNPKLENEILRPRGSRRCQICGSYFIAGSGRAKYCADCAASVHRKQKAAYARKRRSGVDK